MLIFHGIIIHWQGERGRTSQQISYQGTDLQGEVPVPLTVAVEIFYTDSNSLTKED